MSKIEKAIDFIIEKHKGQTRDITNEPYVNHLQKVYQILMQVTHNEDVLVAGLLHDTLEDTNTDYEEIILNFGVKVADLVKECTKSYETLHSKEALIIKFADLLHNVSENPTNEWIGNKCEMIKTCKRCTE